MPKPPKEATLASLVGRQQVLLIRCIPCGRDRYLGPLEAVASYGGLIGFEELRARCRPDCHLVAEPSIRPPDELVIRKGRVP